MREKGQTEVAKTLETPVFSRGIEILTEKIDFFFEKTVDSRSAWMPCAGIDSGDGGRAKMPQPEGVDMAQKLLYP